MARSIVDLHAHTSASDGALTAGKLVALAKRASIRVLGVTDHDTFAALDDAEAAARRAGIELVPGTELTAYFGSHEVHLLAYFVRRHSSALARELSRFRERRVVRMRKMIQKLGALGIRIAEADVIRPGMGAVGRPHLARALVRRGHAEDVADAFRRLIGNRCPAYVRKYRLSMKRAIRLVRESGGVPVVAHPGLYELDRYLGDFRDLGLLGIEAYHSSHDAATTRRYLAFARRLRLIATGGSDFHGGLVKPDVTLGCVRVPMQAYRDLRRAADA